MKIMFSDWQIALAKERLPRQWDNGEPVEVVGAPDGWTWTLNIKLGDDLDVIPLTETDGVLGTTLKAEQLAFAGGYRIQLVGTQGEVVRHTNVVGLAVSESLSGDAQWPELPTVFSEAVERCEAAAVNVPVLSDDGTWKVWDFEKGAYVDTGVSAKAPTNAVLFSKQELDWKQAQQARENIFAVSRDYDVLDAYVDILGDVPRKGIVTRVLSNAPGGMTLPLFYMKGLGERGITPVVIFDGKGRIWTGEDYQGELRMRAAMGATWHDWITLLVDEDNVTSLDFGTTDLSFDLSSAGCKAISIVSPSVSSAAADTSALLVVNGTYEFTLPTFARAGAGHLYLDVWFDDMGINVAYRGRDTDVLTQMTHARLSSLDEDAWTLPNKASFVSAARSYDPDIGSHLITDRSVTSLTITTTSPISRGVEFVVSALY